MDGRVKLDIICNDGSPLGVVLPDVYGDNGRLGVGGAELALLTLCEAWNNAGHRVRLYNDPKPVGASPFEQYPLTSFSPQDDRDILITFRSPNTRIAGAKGKKVWWSCDQLTVGNFREFAKQVDQIVTISKFHSEYFTATYGIEDAEVIDLPVRTWDYEQEIEKIPKRLIFCSVPDRGLDIMGRAYREILDRDSEISLVITSDYRLWGSPSPMNERFISSFLGVPNVIFRGAISRRELIQEQLQAQVHSYPCTYAELFCYAVAECSVAGAFPVTSDIAALNTTNMGTRIVGDVRSEEWRHSFVERIVETVNLPNLPAIQNNLRQKALERFSIERIMREWDTKIFQ